MENFPRLRCRQFWFSWIILAVVSLVLEWLMQRGLYRPDMLLRRPFQQSVISITPQAVHYVIPAGGARQISWASTVAAELYDQGIRPSLLIGASGGAIISAFLAQGEAPEEIVDQWKLASYQLFGVEPELEARGNVLGYLYRLHSMSSRYPQIVKQLSKNLDYYRLVKRETGLIIVTAEAQTNQAHLFFVNVPEEHLPDGIPRTLIDGQAALETAVRASTTVPYFLEPVSWQGNQLYDGVMATPFDLEIALLIEREWSNQGATLIVYIDGNTESRVINPPTYRQTILLQRLSDEISTKPDILVFRPRFGHGLPGGDYYREVLEINQAARETARHVVNYIELDVPSR